MYKCEFCGKTYYNTRSFGFHVKRSEKHNFQADSELITYLCNEFYGTDETAKLLHSYINQECCTHDLSKDHPYVVQLITSLGIKRSNSQEKKTIRYKQKYISTLHNRYGPDIDNVSQIKTVRGKINETLSERHGGVDEYYSAQRKLMKEGYSTYCNDPKNISSRQSKIKNTVETKYGVSNVSQTPEVRTKISDARKREIALLTEDEKRLRTEKARSSIKFESSLETRVKKCLVELGEDFLQHQFLWGYNFDVLLKDKILIEVNGDFWHANPKMYIESDVLLGDLTAAKIWSKDKKKFDKALSKGYTVITIWEKEIKKLCDADLTALIHDRIKDVRRARR